MNGRAAGLLSENLRMLREKAGLNKTQLGELVGVHRTTIGKWETQSDGYCAPELQHLDRLADYYCVEIGDFFRPIGIGKRALELKAELSTALLIVNNHMKDLVLIRKKAPKE